MPALHGCALSNYVRPAKGSMPEVYDQLSEQMLGELRGQATVMSPAQIDARLLELAGYAHPSGRQRAERDILAEAQLAHKNLMVAIAAQGGMQAFADGRAGERVGAPSPMAQLNTPPSVGFRSTIRDDTAQARRVIEARHRDGSLPDYAAERCEGLLNRDLHERTLAARWVEAVGSPAYARAFATWVADPTRGHMLWDREEQDAYRQVQQIRNAMGDASTAGLEMVPLNLDPAIMITSAGSNNAVRQVARVVQTVSNTWQGASSAGATAEWKVENAQAADASFAMAAKPIPVYFADVDVPYSYEVGMDAINFVSELQRVIQDAVTQLTNAAYTTGTGTTQPKGYVPNATAPTRTAGVFTTADVFLLQNSLPARFSAGASWMGNIAVSNAIAQFVTTNGSLMFPEIRGGDSPGKLLTKPWNENSNMSADMATAASRFLAYGDFQQFVVVDRVGAQLQILPGYGANQRPSGQYHAFLYFRTGSDLVIPTAVQVIAKT